MVSNIEAKAIVDASQTIRHLLLLILRVKVNNVSNMSKTRPPYLRAMLARLPNTARYFDRYLLEAR